MGLKADIYTQLTATSGVTDNIGTRLYYGANNAATVTFPYVTYLRISSDHTHHLGGSSGLKQEMIQFDVWDDDPVTCDTVAESLRVALDGAQGTELANITNFRSCTLQAERDDFLAPDDFSHVGTHRVSMDFQFTVEESKPF